MHILRIQHYGNDMPRLYIDIDVAVMSSLFNEPYTTLTDCAGDQRTWVEAGSNAQCDAGAGEVYRSQSPGKVSDIDACKKSCEDDPKCKSITFFNSGWCSHFSTDCKKTKWASKAIAMRLGTQRTVTTVATTAGQVGPEG